ncbi:hypothetical protein C0Q70_03195 [Pomacea canaliculata]|uniref:EF-hand domain-containing protein n=1 Tax=Pomacea canaliculata TaxID=400727 RepID=A0A2T7PS21_POMCA|nr:hypothetical protein C0Q70_03195 [Pomacea canaliculata]
MTQHSQRTPMISLHARFFSEAKIEGDGRIDFAIFLDIMHSHSRVENCQKELLDALMAQDRNHTGYVNAADIRHILTNTGEHLSRNEELAPSSRVDDYTSSRFYNSEWVSMASNEVHSTDYNGCS